MKAEITGTWTWFSVEDEENQKTYVVCEMHDENTGSATLEINNPDDDTEEITPELEGRIAEALEEYKSSPA